MSILSQAFQSLRHLVTVDRVKRASYIPPLAMAMGLMMLRTMLMARILSVHEFSLFSKGVLISCSFCMLGCLGLQYILQRDWPVFLLRKQEYRGLVLAAQSNLVATGCALLVALIPLFGISVSGMTPALFAVGLLHGWSQQLFAVATVESRSRGRTLLFAGQNFARAVAIMIFGLGVAVWTQSAMAALFVEGIITLALSWASFWQAAKRVALGQIALYRLALKRLKKVNWRSARFFMAVSMIAFLQYNVDRWFASESLNSVAFAQYSFAAILLIVGQSAQGVLAASLYPFVARRVVQIGLRRTFLLCAGISGLLLVGGLVSCVPAYYVLKVVVEQWYGPYGNTIALFPLFLGIAVLRLSDFWSTFLAVARREDLLFFANLWSVVLSCMIFAGYGIVRPEAFRTIEGCAVLAGLLAALPYAVLTLASFYVGRQGVPDCQTPLCAAERPS